MRRAICSASSASSSSRPGAGAITVSQTPSTWLRLDDGVGDGLAVRGAYDVGRQLPHEVDLLLGEDGDARAEGVVGVLGGADEPDALAVVAAADGLQDDGEAAALGRERGDVGRVAHDAVPWAGHADRVEPGAHHALVLGVHERVRAGADGDAVRLQGPQVLGGHMFVIEGDHIAAPREVAQRVEVAVVADDDIARRPAPRNPVGCH